MPYAPTQLSPLLYGAPPPEEKWYQRLSRSWAARGAVNAVGWLGESLNRLNVAKNAFLIGDLDTAGRALVPFYETLGLGDVRDVTGADVLKEWGVPAGQKYDIPLLSRLIGPKSARDIAGFLVGDVLTDPLIMFGAFGMTKAGVAAQRTSEALMRAGDVAGAWKAFPLGWAAQAEKGFRGALTFGISAKRATPLVKGTKLLGQLQKYGQGIKHSRIGQMFAHTSDAFIESAKKYVDIKTIDTFKDVQNTRDIFERALVTLPIEEQGQVAWAMEALGRGTAESYGKGTQQVAKLGRDYVALARKLAKDAGMPLPELGGPTKELLQEFEQAVTAKQREAADALKGFGSSSRAVLKSLDGTIARGIREEGIEKAEVLVRGMKLKDVPFKQIAAKDQGVKEITDLMSLRGAIAAAETNPSASAGAIRELGKLWEIAPDRIFRPPEFQRLLKRFGVKTPQSMWNETGSLTRLTRYMVEAESLPESLDAGIDWLKRLQAAEKTIPGELPRFGTRAMRETMQEVAEEVGPRLVEMPEKFVDEARIALYMFKDGLTRPEAKKELAVFMRGMERTRAESLIYSELTRQFVEMDGKHLSIRQVYDAVERAKQDVPLTRAKALAAGLEKRYSFIERWADRVTGRKIRTLPAIYQVETDPARALGRMMEGLVDRIKGKELVEVMKGTDYVSKVAREGWRLGDNLHPGLKGLYVHPHLKAEVAKVLGRIGDPQKLGRLAGFLSDVVGLWKRTTLGPFLAYHTRNITTDLLNDFFVNGNYDLTSFSRAMRALADPDGTIAVRGQPMSVKKLLEFGGASKLGVNFVEGEVLSRFNSSWFRGVEKMFGARGLRAFGSINPFSQNFLITSMGRQREKVHRLASLIHLLDEGVDPITAQLKVKAAFFDYSAKGFSKFEQGVLRQFFPFYSFMRNNTALQAQLLFTRPFYVGAQLKAIPTARTEDMKEEMKILPPWLREGLVFRAGRTGDVVRYIKGVGMPIEDVAELLSFEMDAGRVAEKVLARTSPLIKIPLEWLSDRNFFFGTRIGDYDRAYSTLRHLPKSWQKFLGFRARKTRKGMRWRMDPHKLWLLSQVRGLTLLGRLFDSDRERWERFAWAATGIRTFRLDLEALKLRAERREIDKLTEELEARGEIGVMPIPYVPEGEEPTPEALRLLEAFKARRKRPARAF